MKKILIFIAFLLVLTGCVKIVDDVEPLKFNIIGPSSGLVGESVKLSIDIDEEVSWTSTNPAVASIDSNGFVLNIAVGNTTFIATLKADESNFRTFQYIVEMGNSEIDENFLFYQTKILSIDENNKKMELLNVPYTDFNENVIVNQYLNLKTLPFSFSDLNIGMENIYVAVNKETKLIESILVDGEVGFSRIRVAIREFIWNIADESQIYHDEIVLTPNSHASIRTFDGTKSLEISDKVTISVDQDKIKVTSGSYDFITDKRIIINNSNLIQVNSISRSMGIPEYSGNLEVSLVSGRLLLINDVNIEDYLKKVVPSEMPGNFHIEALKAQAVAARTYAYADIFNKSNIKYGYTVDDSVKSQVYNNQSTNQNAIRAVNDSKGMIMTYDNKPINAYYYSTSAGITASAHEVWINNINGIDPIPYLIGQNLSKINNQPIAFDYQDELSMLDYFKAIKMNTPDNNSHFHRWVTNLTSSQLRSTLNANMKITYEANPELLLTKNGDKWDSLTIPNDIGEVLDVRVSKRGASGVVIELDIETTSGVYKIINQYSIRFTIRPQDVSGVSVTSIARNSDYTYTSNSNNISILYSGFFAIEKSGDTYKFFGGGNGHGVGMSQYGANGLGNSGSSYTIILKKYYSDIDLTDISYSFEAKSNYKQLLMETL